MVLIPTEKMKKNISIKLAILKSFINHSITEDLGDQQSNTNSET